MSSGHTKAVNINAIAKTTPRLSIIVPQSEEICHSSPRTRGTRGIKALVDINSGIEKGHLIFLEPSHNTPAIYRWIQCLAFITLFSETRFAEIIEAIETRENIEQANAKIFSRALNCWMSHRAKQTLQHHQRTSTNAGNRLPLSGSCRLH